MLPFKCHELAHIHVIVNDLDEASEFYSDVLGFIEMQSHHNLVNRGLGTYYGFEEIWDRLEVSLRFMVLPEVMTIKLGGFSRWLRRHGMWCEGLAAALVFR